MLVHELKLNDDKTEFIIFQSKYHENRYSTSSLISQNIIFIFDKYMTMECRSSHYHLRQIGQIQKYLTRDACSNAVRSAVLSRLDYSNALLGGLRKMDLIRLQKLKITSPLCYVTCIGYRLVQGLTYKLCLYMYMALKQTAPNLHLG